MSKLGITDYSLYKWRYIIGYGLVALGLVSVLCMVCLYSPGGTSAQEMQSVVKSNSIGLSDLGSFAIANLPYHLLQKASIAIFGVSAISIKLPSIILASLSAVGLIILLERWFNRNISILSTLIAITTSQFLFIAQDGTPGVMYLFWSVWLLLLASLISRQRSFRTLIKISFFITAALSLYTPLCIYILAALIIAIFLHPHLRYLTRQLSQLRIAIGILIAVLLLAPLVAAIYKNLSLGLTLAGMPSSWPDLGKNLANLGTQYFGFLGASASSVPTPFFGLGSSLLILIGAYDILKNRSSAKSYVIILWILFLLPVVIINPNAINITFLPLVLLLSFGLNSLLFYWYGLFPRNPYARIAGLVPLVVLVGVLIFSGLARNVYGYQYDPNLTPDFSQDINLIPKDTKLLVVSDSELAFYQVVAKYDKRISVSTSPSDNGFTATHDAKRNYPGYRIDKIITTSSSNQADRFYLYKKITK